MNRLAFDKFLRQNAAMEIKPIVLKSVNRAFDVFQRDMEAIPADAFNRSLGGKARTVADIAYEVMLVNEDACANMRGEPGSEWDEGWLKAPADFQSKEIVTAAFAEASAKVIAQIESYSEDELQSRVTCEWGETDRFERCRFIALHTWYHGGQLNFIQTLLGDDEWHWG